MLHSYENKTEFSVATNVTVNPYKFPITGGIILLPNMKFGKGVSHKTGSVCYNTAFKKQFQ